MPRVRKPDHRGRPCFSARETPKEPTLPIGQPRAAISWSGGKDRCAALHRTHALYDVVCMITMVGESAERRRSHGLRPEVLDAHADRLGLRRVTGRCTWQTYEAANSPLFSSPLHVAANGHVPRSGCWALDLNLKSEV